MQTLKNLWAQNKPLVIVSFIVILVILYLIYKQNNAKGQPVTAADPNAPTTTSDQFSAILADLGALTPVTNTIQTNTTTVLQPPPFSATTPVTTAPPQIPVVAPPPVTHTVTNQQAVAQTVQQGIGNDTARDVAIAAAEKKYPNRSQSSQLQAAIAQIQKQYPRTGPTQ